MNLANSRAVKSHGTNEAKECGCSSGLTKPNICLWLHCQEKICRCLYRVGVHISYLDEKADESLKCMELKQ